MSIKLYVGHYHKQYADRSYSVPAVSRSLNSDQFHETTIAQFSPLKETIWEISTYVVDDIVQKYTRASPIFNLTTLFNIVKKTFKKLADCIQGAGKSIWGTYYDLNDDCYITEGKSPVELMEDISLFNEHSNFKQTKKFYYERFYKMLNDRNLIKCPSIQSTDLPVDIVYFKHTDNKSCRIVLLDKERAQLTYLSKESNETYTTSYLVEGRFLLINSHVGQIRIQIDPRTGKAIKYSGWHNYMPTELKKAEVKSIVPKNIFNDGHIVLQESPVQYIGKKATYLPMKAKIEVVKTPTEVVRQNLYKLLDLQPHVDNSMLAMKVWRYVRDNNLSVGKLRFKPDTKLRTALGCTETTLSLVELHEYIT